MTAQFIAQCAAFEQFHHQECARFSLNGVVVDRNHIRMRETGRCARFSSEPLHGVDAVDPVIANQLDRDTPLERAIAGLVHGAHSALSPSAVRAGSGRRARAECAWE